MPRYIVEPYDFSIGFGTILTNFASLGWQNLLHKQEKYYPDLLYQFYANLRKFSIVDNRRQWYASSVSHMEFKFDESLFCRMVEVEDEGIRYYENSSLTDNETQWRYSNKNSQKGINLKD